MPTIRLRFAPYSGLVTSRPLVVSVISIAEVDASDEDGDVRIVTA